MEECENITTSCCNPKSSTNAPNFNVAVGVLTTLLCFAIIAIVVLVIYIKRKFTKVKLQETKESPVSHNRRNQVSLPERQPRVTSPPPITKSEEVNEDYPKNEYDILPKRHKPSTPPSVRQHKPPTPPSVRQHKPPTPPGVRHHKPPTPPNVRKQTQENDDEYLVMDSNVNNGNGDVYENYGITSDDVYGNVEEDDIYINN
ncbi:serine/arginine repetitive matrix protein 1 [Octopus bimaculoides]|uniref:Uncharacterized protein n=1 Tax=Octopus bimaculoides TaxID=37653 RepID=A0A0L8HJU7_OCTBM|nr:serine/arginine repetitive matrix protein 1 [Octopus bimaculoides]XP_052822477.1 serine/arginine repetitive matrix protein 1 [Octopus bimaculoides]|eukprot:XP_014771749.1 PREDICTED: serine/arginine repetitive matrix protein 1-like [Octopus bimaculoides]